LIIDLENGPIVDSPVYDTGKRLLSRAFHERLSSGLWTHSGYHCFVTVLCGIVPRIRSERSALEVTSDAIAYSVNSTVVPAKASRPFLR
jgi:hypothetical protein